VVAPGIVDWEPVWLGSRPRTLYAALHPVPGIPSTGVVLVPPLLDELPRSRRFITEVAGEFAGMGLPSLRFDFHGTGDSSGRGDEFDFDSMRADLDLAVAELRARTGVARLVLLAWRGAALAVEDWRARGGMADLVVLWEPVCDGAAWLRELVDADAEARKVLPPPRPGVPRTGGPDDGQLMGYKASPRLRMQLAQARLEPGPASDHAQVWTVVRPDGGDAQIAATRSWSLPGSAPRFAGGVSMDATLFLTPPMRGFVRELGATLCAGAWT
jgi:hypothetical protein